MIDFHVCGINYKTSTFALRERVAITPDQQMTFLAIFKAATDVDEVGILMTCNRSEWCWSGGDPARVQLWLANYFQIPVQEWLGATYLYSRNDAVRHLMQVASGLDSMMLGEPQIFGQLKTAFQQMQEIGSAGDVAQTVFPVIFAAAKKVRSQTIISLRPTSVAYAAVNLARCIFNDFSSLTLLLVGAGETIELAAKHFTKAGIKHLLASNRTFENAQQLVAMHGGEAVAFNQLKNNLVRADIIVTATASPTAIIIQPDILLAMRQRHRPLYIIDLAMPRDVEETVGSIDGVYLYNLDDLQSIVDEAQAQRESTVAQANTIIERELALFSAKQRTRELVPEICNYRSRIEQLRDNEMQKALQQLKKGIPAEEVLIRFATTLTNKFMHEPTLMLRSLSEPVINN